MIDPKVYFEAAIRAFEDRNPACYAINVSREAYRNGMDYYRAISEESNLFKHFFKPIESHYEPYWFGDSLSEEEQEHRTTALLLMYEMAKDMEQK